jgi:hypothetical protein
MLMAKASDPDLLIKRRASSSASTSAHIISSSQPCMHVQLCMQRRVSLHAFLQVCCIHIINEKTTPCNALYYMLHFNKNGSPKPQKQAH